MERFRAIVGGDASRAADAIVAVLLGAFTVDPERRPGVVAETLASLADPRFMHYLIRRDGIPVAVARRATFDGISYLSSIGAVDAARGQGFGRHVTASAMVDGFAEGSEWVHLGVYSDNIPARRMYESLGLVMAGEPGPDMILIG
jgi:ribosomal protein S18 acetylase RimI-like enzyme